MKNCLLAVLFLIIPAAFGCGNATSDNSTTGDPDNVGSNNRADPHEDHGAVREIGTATIAGVTVTVRQAGHVRRGTESAFDVVVDGQATGIRGWIGPEDYTQSPSGASRAEKEGDGWHLHIMPMETLPVGAPLQIEITADGKTGLASFPVVYAGPHDGVLAVFSGASSGVLELKLHDDKGDLELWLATDATMATPLDLPLETTVAVAITDRNRTVTLAVRNTDRNEDEDDQPTIRDGRTNYFIFPGETGADASWLVGEAFVGTASVTFNLSGGTCTTEPFTLVPHQHVGSDHGHEH